MPNHPGTKTITQIFDKKKDAAAEQKSWLQIPSTISSNLKKKNGKYQVFTILNIPGVNA